MKRLNFLAATSFVIFLILQVFPSCECQRIDCDSGDLEVQFLSKSDDSNLFANGTYQRDSLQLFALASDMTATDYSHQLYGWKNSHHSHSGPYFTLDRNAIGYIFQFNSTERDTLGITFTMSEDSECCSGVPVTTFGLFKGDTIFPDASGSLILKK